MRIKSQSLAVCLGLLLGHVCFGDESGVTLQTGGTQIMLNKGWERLDQPENFFVQQRARNAERNIALSAGSFKIELNLEQYVALGIYGLKQGPEKGMEQTTKFTANLARIPVREVKAAVESQLGQQTLEQIKKASTMFRFEFLNATNFEIHGRPAFEIHSKMTSLKSGQVIFSRQFVYQGTEPQQIVQITYAGASDDIFQDKSLIGFIKRPE